MLNAKLLEDRGDDRDEPEQAISRIFEAPGHVQGNEDGDAAGHEVVEHVGGFNAWGVSGVVAVKVRKTTRMKFRAKWWRSAAGCIFESNFSCAAASPAGRCEVHVPEHGVGQELQAKLLVPFGRQIQDEEGGRLLLEAASLAIHRPCIESVISEVPCEPAAATENLQGEWPVKGSHREAVTLDRPILHVNVVIVRRLWVCSVLAWGVGWPVDLRKASCDEVVEQRSDHAGIIGGTRQTTGRLPRGGWQTTGR